MKQQGIKILISLILIAVVFFLIRWINNPSQTDTEGEINVVIIDHEDQVLFNGNLRYYKNDTLFDVLNQNFDLTCAKGSAYQLDPTCEYTYQSLMFQGKVILGIQSDTFSIISDWRHTFIYFERYDQIEYVMELRGPSQIQGFKDGDKFQISLREVGIYSS